MRIKRFKFVLLILMVSATGLFYLNIERIHAELKSYFKFLTPVVSLPSPTWNNVEKNFLDRAGNYAKSENDIENSMNSGCSLPKVKYENIRQIEFSLLYFSLKKWKHQTLNIYNSSNFFVKSTHENHVSVGPIRSINPSLHLRVSASRHLQLLPVSSPLHCGEHPPRQPDRSSQSGLSWTPRCSLQLQIHWSSKYRWVQSQRRILHYGDGNRWGKV